MATTVASSWLSGVEPVSASDVAARGSQLYERHARTIYAFCRSRLGNPQDAEDAAQTTFLNAFRSLQRGVVPELELAWLLKIANHAILNRRRAASRRRRVEEPRDPEVLQAVTPAIERDVDTLIGLERVLASMAEQPRRALLMREWQGLSYREIREELGISEAALEALLFRARRSLAAGLEQPDRVRTRRRRMFDLTWLFFGLKTLFGGGAATAVAVASLGVVGTVVTAPFLHLGSRTRPAHVAAARVPRVAGASMRSFTGSRAAVSSRFRLHAAPASWASRTAPVPAVQATGETRVPPMAPRPARPPAVEQPADVDTSGPAVDPADPPTGLLAPATDGAGGEQPARPEVPPPTSLGTGASAASHPAHERRAGTTPALAEDAPARVAPAPHGNGNGNRDAAPPATGTHRVGSGAPPANVPETPSSPSPVTPDRGPASTEVRHVPATVPAAVVPAAVPPATTAASPPNAPTTPSTPAGSPPETGAKANASQGGGEEAPAAQPADKPYPPSAPAEATGGPATTASPSGGSGKRH